MERGFIVARAGTALGDAMMPDHIDDVRPIVVERRADRRTDPAAVRTWLAARTNPDVHVEKFVESRLVICRDQDLLSLAFARLKRHRAGAAVVFRGTARPASTMWSVSSPSAPSRRGDQKLRGSRACEE